MAKIGISIGVLLLLFTLLFMVKTQKDISDKQQAIEKSMVEMKQLGDGIVRSQGQYVSKDDLDKLGQDLGLNLKTIKSDLGSLGANLQGINTMTVATSGYHGTGLASGGTKSNGNPAAPIGTDPYGYLTNMQIFALNEPLGSNNVPFGQATFSAWQPKPWGLDIYPRNYNVATVIGQDADGRHYTYNKFTVTTQGKTYEVPIQSSKFEEVYPDPSFSFNPRIYLGLNGGAIVNPLPHAEMTPVLSVFLFSYGKLKADPDWATLGLGIGYETQMSRPVLAITPITYNIGHHLPLVRNLHIAPTITVDTKGSFSVLGGVFVGL